MKSKQHHAWRVHRSQQGVALVVSMILLTIITLLSVSAMRSTNLDSKIAVNHQFKELSFQAAENALAQLTGPNPQVQVPNAVGASVTMDTPPYYSSTGVLNQPDIAADLTLEMLEISPPGKYKFSGFGLNVVTVLYQADSVGRVVDNNTVTTNRMEVALIRN
ncbi:pilus assembly PilX family protein [Candidatus Thiodiazotropha sp. CDECU1]|uniref:pilus assembly PilX family protein n=1 Tax=Candidatus Thiodiazotropha sp. CDECU1 TaxID=3065865 RepID=UPI00292F4AC1|nr:PilX N-terminal domain-containing pilus assembly protein [Candidatus Thiodiazotropha sp. CDECU1]